MVKLTIRLSPDEEAHVTDNLRERVDVAFVHAFIFPWAPRKIVQKLIAAFSSPASPNILTRIGTGHQFVDLLNVFQAKQQLDVRHRLLIALATTQKFNAKSFDHSVSRNELGELIGEAPVATNDKIGDITAYAEKRRENCILNFLLYATLDKYWTQQSVQDIIIASISGVCHLSRDDIERLYSRFHQLTLGELNGSVIFTI